jgi:hypothetical protein
MKRFAFGLAAMALGCGHAAPPEANPTYLSREELLDPVTCQKCHAKHYQEWSGSMHAYASDDPVFIAMNKRGQREGKIGTFCVNCHAPMAVQTGATVDGLNLDTIPQKLKGITCYFCHSVDAVAGSHDNPLHLAGDNVMRGQFSDPVPNTAHASAYSALHDRDELQSSQFCGSCHDIQSPLGAHVERTFEEWSESVFSQAPGGTTCSQCHMEGSRHPEPAADAPGVFSRTLHSHTFPGVDVALTAFPEIDVQRQEVQAFLDTTVQGLLCVRGIGALTNIQVILDNVAAGHHWPSGAAQDRRAWVEVTAFVGGQKIYPMPGLVQDPVATPPAAVDPDLWLLRDCLFDGADKETHMFWEAKRVESNQLPGQLTFDASDIRYYQSHILQTYPRSSASTLGQMPDRVEMRVRLTAIGGDVIDDLVASGDLAAAYRDKIPTYTLGSDRMLVWTPATATENFLDASHLPVSCISTSPSLSAKSDTVPAAQRMSCKP